MIDVTLCIHVWQVLETSFKGIPEAGLVGRRRFLLRRVARGGIDASSTLDVEPLAVADIRWKFLKPLKALLKIIAHMARVTK